MNGHLFQSFLDAASQYGDCPAVSDEAGSCTYRELLQRVEGLSQHLRGFADDHQEPVVCLTRHGIPSLVSLLATWGADKFAVPLPLETTPQRLQQLIDHSQAKFILTDAQTEPLACTIGGSNRVILNLDSDEAHAAGLQAEDRPRFESRQDDIAVIAYTSGSSGPPKGVIHSHASILFNIGVHTETLALKPTDRALLLAKSHTISGLTDSLRMLLNGGALMPIEMAIDGLPGIVAALRDFQPTIVHFVPTMFRRLVNRYGRESDFQHVRILHLGGEPATRYDFDLFQTYFSRDAVLLNNLGCTEAPTFRQSFLRHDSTWAGNVVPLNQAVSGKRVVLVDSSENLRDQERTSGEIMVRSRFIARGYWRDPERTARFFHQLDGGETCFLTGDLGRITADGTLEYLGRKDHQIKRLGQKLDLVSIEEVIRHHPEVDEVAVVALSQETTTRLIAYCAGGSSLDEAEIQNYARSQLATFELPEFVVLDSLPTLPNGKIDKRRLLEIVRRESPPVETLSLAVTPMEQHLAKIWESVLNTTQIGRGANFFELGGDSLHMVDCLAEIEKQLGKRVSPTTLIENPELDRFARAIELSSAQPTSAYYEVLRETSSSINILIVGLPAVKTVLTRLPPEYNVSRLKLDDLEVELFKRLSIEQTCDMFVDALSAAKAKPPTAIVGFSYGGLVAYALSHRLRQSGLSCPLTVLIEPSLAIPNSPMRRLSEAGREVLRLLLPQNLHLFARRLWDSRSTVRASFSLGHQWEQIRPFVRRNRRKFQPSRYAGDVALIGSRKYLTHRPYWEQLVEGRLHVLPLETGKDHFGAFQEVNAISWTDWLVQNLNNQSRMPPAGEKRPSSMTG